VGLSRHLTKTFEITICTLARGTSGQTLMSRGIWPLNPAR